MQDCRHSAKRILVYSYLNHPLFTLQSQRYWCSLIVPCKQKWVETKELAVLFLRTNSIRTMYTSFINYIYVFTGICWPVVTDVIACLDFSNMIQTYTQMYHPFSHCPMHALALNVYCSEKRTKGLYCRPIRDAQQFKQMHFFYFYRKKSQEQYCIQACKYLAGNTVQVSLLKYLIKLFIKCQVFEFLAV